jgi:type IV pilus assembly protein PilA
MTTARSQARAFTLVELMMVVAIIGVLASLAIYGVSQYLRHSKTAEATRSLGSIENGQRAQYVIETPANLAGAQTFYHEFCLPTSTAVPATPPPASKYSSTAADWSASTWTCLKFSISDPQYYSYAIGGNSQTGTSATYTADAFGDLNGNGVLSDFEIQGAGATTGDAMRLKLIVVNEDE